jgi:hypothetical protein
VCDIAAVCAAAHAAGAIVCVDNTTLTPLGQRPLDLGADLVVESSKWYGFDRIMELAPPIVLGRVGVTYEGAPPAVLPEISSTEVRASIAERRWVDVEPFMPRAALAYARERGLYAPSSPPP